MRKMTLLVVFVFAILCTPAAFACDQMCRYDGCVTVGWTTGMACHMSGAVCIEDQAYGCWLAEAEQHSPLAPNADETAPAVCTAQPAE